VDPGQEALAVSERLPLDRSVELADTYFGSGYN
jgi:hypothetical protein